MTQENKELLIKDLCSRMPYNVKVKFKVNEVIANEEKFVYNVDGEYSYITAGKSYLTLDIIKMLFNNYLDEIKPYLFPLSSMTKEQQKEYRKICDLDIEILENQPMRGEPIPATYNSQDWLDKNHFDYRGLIPKGLAEDATNKNIY